MTLYQKPKNSNFRVKFTFWGDNIKGGFYEESARKRAGFHTLKQIVKRKRSTMALRFKNVLSSLGILACFCLICAVPLPAHAGDKISKLTEDIIKEFVQRTAEITSGQDGTMSEEEIMEYLDRHLHKKAYFKSTIKYNIPGQPQQKNAMSLKKREFMENVKKGHESVEDYETQIEVKSVKISKDKNKATVVTKGKEKAIMPVPTQDGGVETIPIEGDSTCNQIIMLSAKGIIQMYSANCTTTINFMDY